jgi:arabinan endo-1,5-alpha-L-arabinosidase
MLFLVMIPGLVSCGEATSSTVPAAPAPSALKGDFRVHDPSMIRQGDTYYVFSTGDEQGLNQGNIQIRTSTDLVTWELAGTVFPTIPDWIG